MTISNWGEDKLLDAVWNGAANGLGLPTADLWIQLHTGNPGEDGTSNQSAHARVQVPFEPSNGGTTSNTGDVDFTNMPNETIVAWSAWDAQTNGHCWWTGWLSTGGGLALHDTETADDTIHSPNHGLGNDDRVVFEAIEGLSIPGGLSAGTVYWVTGTPNEDDYTVSTTQDGGAVDITTDGQGVWRKVTPKVMNTGDLLRVAAGDLDVYLD